MPKTVVGISVVGPDRGGVVAAFTSFVFQRDGNIEKISQNVVKGLFGMYLEASFSKSPDRAEFESGLDDLAKKHGMEVSAHHSSTASKQIAVFVTREPHCLRAILGARPRLRGGKIAVIIGTDRTLAPMAKRARIPFVAITERNQAAAEEKILAACKKYDIDVIALARYMRILTPNFVWRYPDRIINIHPSLLPAFPGALAYEQAHERGTKIAGVTAHYVTENLDQGPIILQKSFRISAEDTLEQIKAEGQKLEAETLLEALRLHLRDGLEVRWRKVHARGRRQ